MLSNNNSDMPCSSFRSFIYASSIVTLWRRFFSFLFPINNTQSGDRLMMSSNACSKSGNGGDFNGGTSLSKSPTSPQYYAAQTASIAGEQLPVRNSYPVNNIFVMPGGYDVNLSVKVSYDITPSGNVIQPQAYQYRGRFSSN